METLFEPLSCTRSKICSPSQEPFFHRNPDGTIVENIAKKLCVKCQSLQISLNKFMKHEALQQSYAFVLVKGCGSLGRALLRGRQRAQCPLHLTTVFETGQHV